MRKSVYVLVSLLFYFMIVSPVSSDAHPGRTDSNGGHTCHTNCEKWGLEYGEYHYHNGGDTSDSGSSNSSDSEVETEIDTESDTNSNNDTDSSTESDSKSGLNSTNNNDSEAPAKADPKPEPKIDKKQVKADKHYEKALEYYNDGHYNKALKELDKIQELEKDDNKTDQLINDTLESIYEKAESKLKSDEYENSKELLDIILDYKHSDSKIEKKANKLLDKVKLKEKIADLLEDAASAKENQEYEEALTLIKKANEEKETKEADSLFDAILDDILDLAESSYTSNEFEKAKENYEILYKHTESTNTKDEYQIIFEQLEDILTLQSAYKLDTIDINNNSLFTNLIKNNDVEIDYNKDIVKQVSTILSKNNEEKKVQFIFNINLKEFSSGGQNNES